MYKCKDCGKQFIDGKRRDKSQVITDYVEGKQTLQQLASKYKVSERTIRRDLENMRFVRKKARCKEVTVQLDTSYWGRRFGLMVIKDALRNKILWHKYVCNETVSQYMEGISWLRSQGFKIYGAVIDGMRGLAQALYPIPYLKFYLLFFLLKVPLRKQKSHNQFDCLKKLQNHLKKEYFYHLYINTNIFFYFLDCHHFQNIGSFLAPLKIGKNLPKAKMR